MSKRTKPRREPVDLPTIVDGECDFCGSEIVGKRKYCSPVCRTKYNNLCASQGKQIAQAAKHWALHRGAKGTNGAGMMQIIRNKADDFIREDRERKNEHRKS